MSTAQTTNARDPGRWMTLYSVIVAMLTTVIDGALMGLIAPAVKQDLGADTATMGLLSTISMLMLAAFIFGGGTLGDIFGRKRILSYGLIGMMAASVLAFVVPSARLLIPVRAMSGIMAALVNPLAVRLLACLDAWSSRVKNVGQCAIICHRYIDREVIFLKKNGSAVKALPALHVQRS